MTTFQLANPGDVDLAAAARFLEGWPPTRADRPDGPDRTDGADLPGGPDRLGTAGAGDRGSLRWATCLDGSWTPVDVAVHRSGGDLACQVRGTDDRPAAEGHVARVLSIDVDGGGLAAVGRRDGVAGALLAAHRGLRPVCFWTPYEAAVWGVLSQRSSMAQASAVKHRMARELGVPVGAGRAFPPPESLVRLGAFPGLPEVKVRRLRAVAGAALAGRLDPARLRSLGVGEALAELRAIEGIGPFTAELVLVRGAGHPDVFPRHERRLHAAVRSAYRRPDATVDDLAALAGAWAPYRSWVAFLHRVDLAAAQSAQAARAA